MENQKEKKWNVEKVSKTVVLVEVIAIVVAMVASAIFPNPMGANVELIMKLICSGTIVTSVLILVMWIYRAKKNKRMLKIFSILLCLLLIVVIALNVILSKFYVLANQFLHRNTTAAELVVDETEQARAITEQLEAEGLVLLCNEEKTLPLAADKVNVFGTASDAIVYGGSGSGAADESLNINLQTALSNAGIEVNEELTAFYDEKNDADKGKNGIAVMLSSYDIKEPSIEEYGNELIENAKEFSDVAIVVFGRCGGEGADMPMDMAGYEGGTAGRHYMELAENEEAMLDMVRENFEKVVVLVNASSPMELGFLEDKDVDAALWIGGPGSVGLQAVANAITGDVNPSGRLTDTYAYDATSSPAYMNAGDFSYTGTKQAGGGMGSMLGLADQPYKFVNYQEGIYVGYRYYETAAFDGYINYDETVQYPFGYGLSYTTFEQKMGDIQIADGNISVDVTVTNTGNTAGKEVTQLYYTPPYTPGGIEKSHVVMAAFDKTDELQPGESQTLTLTFAEEDMASYDYKDAKAYMLEKGSYDIKLMKNSHEVIDQRTYEVAETVKNRESDQVKATNQFDDVASDINYVSRADWEGTMPKERAKDQTPSPELVKALTDTSVETDPNAEDIVFAKHGLALADVKGLDYDDPKWEQLLEQLSIKDMEQLIGMSGWQSVRVGSVGKPEVLDVDGPAGLNGLINGTKGNQYTSEIVVASTWNKDLTEEFGKALGAEAYANKVSGLYGPAMNIHRTPFSGRNFEYYSEDGLLSGKMGVAMVRGCNDTNTYTFIKHFAMNDQESNAMGVAVWSNEQAMRELYLKPFEISVKEGKSKAMMSTWSRIGTKWAGGSKALLTNVLRDEWGFQGFVITDNSMMGDFQDADQAIAAGNDMMLSSIQKEITIDETAEGCQLMRQACHNILYVVANSNALELARPGVPGWIYKFVLIDAILLGLIALGLMGCTKKKKIKNNKNDNDGSGEKAVKKEYFLPKKVFDNKKVKLIGILFVVLMVIGSFFDYQISSLIYNEKNAFGNFFAAFGEVPAMLCMAIAGALMIKIAQKEHIFTYILSWIFGILLNVLAFMAVFFLPSLYIDLPAIVRLLLAALLVIGGDILVVKMSEGTDRAILKKVILLFAVTPLLEMIIINIIKVPWGRPRMRMIAIESAAVFQPWWVVGSDVKENLMALGVAAEEFKSFPSGHTGNAACMLLLSVFPVFCSKLRGKENLLFGISVAFTFMVALSRIIMGAHFLTDTTVGFMVTSLVLIGLYKLIFRKVKSYSWE